MFTNRIVKLFVLGSSLATLAFVIQNTVAKANNMPGVLPVVPDTTTQDYQVVQPKIKAPDMPSSPNANSLEMLYAQPWLKASEKPTPTVGTSLEMFYAQQWLKTSEKPHTAAGTPLEMLYAQPWIEAAKKAAVEQASLKCQVSLETMYACSQGYIP